MKLKDFFYFSRGERQALILLALIVGAAWTAVFFTEPYRNHAAAVAEEQAPKTILSVTDTVRRDSTRRLSASSPRSAYPPPASRYKRTRPFERYTSSYKRYQKAEKYPKGTTVELNSADTTSLKKIPGIGSSFAKRIVRYRESLGGFYSVEQLTEVFGMDEERYYSIRPWFTVDSSLIVPLKVNIFSWEAFPRHPYLSYPQKKAIIKLVEQKGKLQGWSNLVLLNEFSDMDIQRLRPYLSFE